MLFFDLDDRQLVSALGAGTGLAHGHASLLFPEATIRNVPAETGFELVESMKYCHIVTFRVPARQARNPRRPLAGNLAESVATFDWSAPRSFRFGDIKLFVCRKSRRP
jgi:hypothetical protein